MFLKLITLCSLTIFVTSCRDTSAEFDAETGTQQPKESKEKEILITDLPQLLKSGMEIKEIKEVLNKVNVKQFHINKDSLLRICFCPEQEKSGNIAAIDLQLNGDLVTACKFGYRK